MLRSKSLVKFVCNKAVQNNSKGSPRHLSGIIQKENSSPSLSSLSSSGKSLSPSLVHPPIPDDIPLSSFSSPRLVLDNHIPAKTDGENSTITSVSQDSTSSVDNNSVPWKDLQKQRLLIWQVLSMFLAYTHIGNLLEHAITVLTKIAIQYPKMYSWVVFRDLLIDRSANSGSQMPSTSRTSMNEISKLVPFLENIKANYNKSLTPATIVANVDGNSIDDWGHFTDFAEEIESTFAVDPSLQLLNSFNGKQSLDILEKVQEEIFE